MYQVYVIMNDEGRHYIGLSDDVERRVRQHNMGLSQWTKRMGPWHKVWVSEEMPLGEARKLENKLKRQRGGKGFYTITGLIRSKCS